MTRVVASLEGTIARACSQLGVWWPNPWWPTGNSAYNDCAAFVSWCLWGLNGNQPYQIVVSGVIERSGLEFHAGAAGIRRGDIAGFRWTTASNYDHTELVLSSPSPLGMIQTIGANGGGSDKVAIHTRSTGYIHNYARPAYPNTTTAGGNATGITNSIGEHDMLGIGMATVGASFTLTSAGRLIHHVIETLPDGITPYPRETALMGSALQQPNGSMWVESDDDFARILWAVGRFDLGTKDGIQLIKDKIKANPGHVFEPPPVPVAVTLTDAQLTQIGAAVKVPTPDLKAITDAITAGDAQLLAAIGQVDENTLATFGLKRA